MANSNSSKSKILNQESAEEISVMYRECWRNHAVLIGGYAADGCGEFIPKGNQGTKEALLCEACDCHRNFHRKELIKNGLTLVGSHHFPTNYMWGERKGVGFYPLVSVCPCYEVQNDLVTDEESAVYSGSQGEMTEMKASKKPRRESS